MSPPKTSSAFSSWLRSFRKRWRCLHLGDDYRRPLIPRFREVDGVLQVCLAEKADGTPGGEIWAVPLPLDDD